MRGTNPFQKFVQDFKTYFRRSNHRAASEESEEGQDKEPEANVMSEQSPGDVRLNSGIHRRVYGVRRKIIAGLLLCVLVAFITGYIVSEQDSDKKSPPPSEPTAQEAKIPSSMGEDLTKEELSYQELRALDQRSKGQRTVQAQSVAQEQNAMSGSSSAGLPQEPAIAYTASTNLPHAVSMDMGAPAAPPVVPDVSAAASSADMPSVRSAKERAEAEEARRFASAIAFALSGKTDTTGNTAQTSTDRVQEPLRTPNTIQTARPSTASMNSYVLQAGTLIPAMLFTGISTDIPGQVIAQVSADVYDSLTQSHLLIPAGARLLGAYTDGTANGRVNVIFSTLILPDGTALDIGSSMTAVDGGGYSGILGKVHRHTSRVIGGGMLSSAIAALGSLASGNTSARDTYTGGQVAMQGALANLIATTSNMLSQQTNVQPTVTVEPGHAFQIYVLQPITFDMS